MRSHSTFVVVLVVLSALVGCRQPTYRARADFDTPLVLDWNRDGRIATRTATDASPTAFDFDGDGRTVLVDWLAPTERFLALDLDRDGWIRDGRELFGDGTRLADGTRAPDGFVALAQWDANHDGRIDARDPVFSHLVTWCDADGDGKGSPDELASLAEAGVDAFPLSFRHVPRGYDQLVGFGSRVALAGRFADASGRRGLLLDVVFQHLQVQP